MSHFDPLRTTDEDCPECGAYVPEVDRLKEKLKEAMNERLPEVESEGTSDLEGVCAICYHHMQTDDGCEPTKICHHCAHTEIERLAGELEEANKKYDPLMNAAACVLAECGHLEYPSIALLRSEVERINKTQNELQRNT